MSDKSRSSYEDVISSFRRLVGEDVAVPVAAMNSLIIIIRTSRATTWMQLEQELGAGIDRLKRCKREDLGGRTNISLGSGCDLFMKYVTRAFNMEMMEFAKCKEEILRRGEKFAGISLSSREHIAKIGHSFVEDGCTVLLHGQSRVVTALLLRAAKTKQFNILITEGRPSNEDSTNAAATYARAGIPTTVIPDCAVGHVMDRVDLCLVGAEGVMENGGIVNKLGTYQIAMVAKALKRPFYVAVESYKFARMYPLTQRDIVDLCELPSASPSQAGANIDSDLSDLSADFGNGVQYWQATIDFTPAEFITLLFTDLGVLTPAAVSDELIRLYQ